MRFALEIFWCSQPLFLTIGLAQQDGGRRVVVGDGLDIHGMQNATLLQKRKGYMPIYMGTYCCPKQASPLPFQRLNQLQERKFG